ncbi:MAG: sensor histidine kinase [Bacteroidota bacterium]
MKIQFKLTLLMLSLSIGIILATSIFSTISLENYYRTRLIEEMKTQIQQAEFIIRDFTENNSANYNHLQQYAKAANVHLTMIDTNGAVIFESDLPPDKIRNMENHLQRPEVQQSIQEEYGLASRRSATIDLEMLYIAKKIITPFPPTNHFHEAAFIRVSVPLTQINAVMSDIRSKILLTSIILLVVVTGISIYLSTRMARPIKDMAFIAEQIRSGDLGRRIPLSSGGEFGKLALSLNSMVDKLNEDITKLKKLERVRTEFLGNVSHELRTPIFAIQGILETLSGGALEDKEVSKDFVNRALENTKRLNALLSDLIEISRIESGDMKLSFRYFPVRELLSQVVEEMSHLARERNIMLEFDGTTPAREVVGDKERLKQVMINLIDNAIKYNKPDGHVKVSYEQGDKGITISVSDAGVGIPAEHIPRIFERFYRVDKERSREAGGTGLGLAIVKHILEAHGSKIEVQSEPGKGSVFQFTLKG